MSALLLLPLLWVVVAALHYRDLYLQAIDQRDAYRRQAQFWFSFSHRAERDARAVGSDHRIGVEIYANSDERAVALLLAETKPC